MCRREVQRSGVTVVAGAGADSGGGGGGRGGGVGGAAGAAALSEVDPPEGPGLLRIKVSDPWVMPALPYIEYTWFFVVYLYAYNYEYAPGQPPPHMDRTI